VRRVQGLTPDMAATHTSAVNDRVLRAVFGRTGLSAQAVPKGQTPDMSFADAANGSVAR
jgi:hypothetical protein